MRLLRSGWKVGREGGEEDLGCVRREHGWDGTDEERGTSKHIIGWVQGLG